MVIWTLRLPIENITCLHNVLKGHQNLFILNENLNVDSTLKVLKLFDLEESIYFHILGYRFEKLTLPAILTKGFHEYFTLFFQRHLNLNYLNSLIMGTFMVSNFPALRYP